jgi:hypothetical protein
MKNSPVLLPLLMIVACVALPQANVKPFHSGNPMMTIELGQHVSRVTEVMGKPASMNIEKFPSIEYEVWEYSSSQGGSLGYFTVDPQNKRVIGRSVEVDNKDGYPLGQLVQEDFPKNKFDQYIPCHGRGSELVLVDSAQGIFIIARNNRVSLVSWADQQLTKLRVDQFYLKCPQIQPKKQK